MRERQYQNRVQTAFLSSTHTRLTLVAVVCRATSIIQNRALKSLNQFAALAAPLALLPAEHEYVLMGSVPKGREGITLHRTRAVDETASGFPKAFIVELFP